MLYFSFFPFLKFMNKKLNTHLNVPENLVGIKIAAQPSTEEELRIFYKQPRISEYGGESRLELLISSKCKNMHHENLNVLSTPQRMNCDK